MPRRRPEFFALLMAVMGSITVLVAFTFDLHASRQRELAESERSLQHFSLMMAEHTARTFEAIHVLLREIAADLSTNRTDWRQWPQAKGWAYLTQRHSRALPQLRDLILFDETGTQRFISTYLSTPVINIKDRPYFIRLHREEADFASFGPYVGRNSGRYTYGLARRIQDARGRFAGASFAAIEPAYFQDFCWFNGLGDEFESVLVNAQEQIIAACRPNDLSRNATFIGSRARDTLFGGRFKDYVFPPEGLDSYAGTQVSVSPVPHFPDLRIISVRTQASVLAGWNHRAIELGVLAALVVAILLIGGWQVWRRTREMHAVNLQIEAHRQDLSHQFSAATAEIARQKIAAEHANKAKSRFLAATSHDLRQPLHALSLFTADLQRQLEKGNLEEIPRLADQIRTSSGLLGELLDSLLDISRLDVGGITPQPRHFALWPLFERLRAGYGRFAQNNSQRLVFRPNDYYALTDPVLVERLLANLLSNALRYTPKGGTVLVAARRRGATIVIEVRDNGIGIAPEHQKAIFGEFYQIGNTAREAKKGLGLGLSIVERLSQTLQCPMGLRSLPGKGAVFWIALPAAPATLVEPDTPLPEHRPKSAPILFVGPGLEDAARLAAAWEMPALYREDAAIIDRRLAPGLIVAEESVLPGLPPALIYNLPLVVVCQRAESAATYTHALTLPIRPAKLRALLEQLQKTPVA